MPSSAWLSSDMTWPRVSAPPPPDRVRAAWSNSGASASLLESAAASRGRVARMPSPKAVRRVPFQLNVSVLELFRLETLRACGDSGTPAQLSCDGSN